MKKVAGLLVCVLMFAGIGAQFAQAAASTDTNAKCVPFDEMLYYAKDTWLRTVADYSNKKEFKDAADKTTLQVARLHEILGKEGFVVGKDRDIEQYGFLTAIAVAGLQNKYKADLLSSQGYTFSNGVVDGKVIQWLNQKYPCPASSNDNGGTSSDISNAALKFSDQGGVEMLPTGTLLNAKYALTKITKNASASTTFSYINTATGAETVVKQSKDKNGNYVLGSVVPAPGTYTVRGKIDGTAKTTEFTLIATSVAAPTVGFTISGPIGSITAGKNISVTISSTFPKTEDQNKMVIELKKSNGELITLGMYKIARLKNSETVLIPKTTPAGTYTIVGDYSYKGNPYRAETVTSFPIVAPVTTSSVSNTGSTGNSSGTGNTSGTSGDADDGLSTDGVQNSSSITVTSPTSATSVVAGKNVNVKVSATNVSNSSKAKISLVGASGETTLKEAGVYYCPVSDCIGVKSRLGQGVTIPKATAAGSYKIKVVVTLPNGLTINDTGDSFTVTN